MRKNFGVLRTEIRRLTHPVASFWYQRNENLAQGKTGEEVEVTSTLDMIKEGQQ